jgi:DNA-binding Xre family transcriptional regulator
MPKRRPKDRLVWTLADVLAARGETAYALAKRVTGVSESTVYRAARTDAECQTAEGPTLRALCRALDCQPGDLLRYEP